MTYARSSTPPSFLINPRVLALAFVLGGCGDDAAADGAGTGSGTAGTAASETDPVVDGTASGGPVTGTGGTADGGSTDDGGSSGDTGEPKGGLPCLDDQYVNGPSPGPNYSELGVTIGSHCQGTNHQDITGVERVVFVGDSVTVGTRPTGAADFYRTHVAAELATLFGLQPPEFQWNQANPLTGTSIVQESGDFANCSVWGARNDDLQTQLDDCFAPEDFDLRTLVITTMGGNDVSAIAQDAIAGVTADILFMDLEEMVSHHESAVQWLLEPGRFTNGVFVVNANVYEYTDYTVDVLSCPAAGTVGFDMNPDNHVLLLSSLNLINEEYARIARENGTDIVFMMEGFCGHGFHADDPANPCYRGPGNENWFDFTCIHPTASGHAALADMFINVISE